MEKVGNKVVAVAGVGNLGKYICEEVQAAGEFEVVVLSRKESLPFCTSRSIPVHKTDYTHDSLLDIFNTTQACTVISFINSASSEEYLGAHTALLSACQESTACKRLIPSEWIGDIDTWPLKPAFYAKTREPFRRMLRGQSREEEKKVEWTCVAVGWLMDYFLEERREEVYIPKVGVEEFPVDVQGWRAITRETGDERQSWTWGRDVGRGVVELLRAEKDSWEETICMAGELSTFNAAIHTLEKHHGRPMPRKTQSAKEIQESLAALLKDKPDSDECIVVQIQEMTVLGCFACSTEQIMRHREKYFTGIEFRGLKELLETYSSVRDVSSHEQVE